MAPLVTVWCMEDSPPSWAVRMLAYILEVELDLRIVDFMAKEHKSPEMLKRNPMGTVPVLQDGDFIVSESHTIMAYLLEKYGRQHKERLYPSDVRARALVDQAMYFDTGVAFIRVNTIALPALFGGFGATGITPAAIEQTEEVYGITEAYLERTRYAAADHLTLADLSLGTTIIALDSFYKINAARFPRVAAWLARLAEEPCFKTITLPKSVVAAKVIHDLWEQNRKAAS